MDRRRALQLYSALAWLFVGCVVVQFFLAGVAVFDPAVGFAGHVAFGHLIGWLTLGLLAVALVGRLGRGLVVSALALLVLFAVQSLLVAARAEAPIVAALHPLNGVVILVLGIAAARRATHLARIPRSPIQIVNPQHLGERS